MMANLFIDLFDQRNTQPVSHDWIGITRHIYGEFWLIIWIVNYHRSIYMQFILVTDTF